MVNSFERLALPDVSAPYVDTLVCDEAELLADSITGTLLTGRGQEVRLDAFLRSLFLRARQVIVMQAALRLEVV